MWSQSKPIICWPFTSWNFNVWSVHPKPKFSCCFLWHTKGLWYHLKYLYDMGLARKLTIATFIWSIFSSSFQRDSICWNVSSGGRCSTGRYLFNDFFQHLDLRWFLSSMESSNCDLHPHTKQGPHWRTQLQTNHIDQFSMQCPGVDD